MSVEGPSPGATDALPLPHGDSRSPHIAASVPVAAVVFVDPPSFSEDASVELPFAPQEAAKSAKAQTKMMSDRFTLNFPLKDCAVDTVVGSSISTWLNMP
ncbi:unannotated protein [freshwater metagenome]|uniref:Unannotated protein n=1 Tax=freshwater metagenome TaxID=449393 RepID=A0A6J7SJP0_9ZZZZ